MEMQIEEKDGKQKSVKVQGLEVVKPPSSKPKYFETGKHSRGPLKMVYKWDFDAGGHWNYIKLAVVVFLVLSFNMYQLWPSWARNIVWFISVTLLLFILGVCVLQGLLFLLVWPTGYSFWLLPNFTSDDAPLWLLFTPFYTFEKSRGSNALLRGVLVALIAFAVYYVALVPKADWVEFIESQGKIVQDLYAGNLLTDGKEGGDGALSQVRFENPFAPKHGPGRYMGRAVPIPKMEDLEKLGEEKDVEERPLEDSEAESPAAEE